MPGGASSSVARSASSPYAARTSSMSSQSPSVIAWARKSRSIGERLVRLFPPDELRSQFGQTRVVSRRLTHSAGPAPEAFEVTRIAPHVLAELLDRDLVVLADDIRHVHPSPYVPEAPSMAIRVARPTCLIDHAGQVTASAPGFGWTAAAPSGRLRRCEPSSGAASRTWTSAKSSNWRGRIAASSSISGPATAGQSWQQAGPIPRHSSSASMPTRE